MESNIQSWPDTQDQWTNSDQAPSRTPTVYQPKLARTKEFRYHFISRLLNKLIKGLIRMQPCVVKRILRKTPVSRRGLLEHAAKAGARRAKIQYVNTHQPRVYLHDIRAHWCRKAQGEFSQGPLKQRWNDVWSKMPVNYEPWNRCTQFRRIYSFPCCKCEHVTNST